MTLDTYAMRTEKREEDRSSRNNTQYERFRRSYQVKKVNKDPAIVPIVKDFIM